MSEALAVLPKGVTRRQWRLAALLPRAEVAYQACVEAGFSISTARKQSRRLSEAVGTKRALAIQAEAKRDNAQEIDRLSAKAVLKEVTKEDVDPSFALSSWATARKIRNEYPDEQETVTLSDREEARASVLKYCRIAARVAAYRATRLLPPSPSTTTIETTATKGTART